MQVSGRNCFLSSSSLRESATQTQVCNVHKRNLTNDFFVSILQTTDDGIGETRRSLAVPHACQRETVSDLQEGHQTSHGLPYHESQAQRKRVSFEDLLARFQGHYFLKGCLLVGTWTVLGISCIWTTTTGLARFYENAGDAISARIKSQMGALWPFAVYPSGTRLIRTLRQMPALCSITARRLTRMTRLSDEQVTPCASSSSSDFLNCALPATPEEAEAWRCVYMFHCPSHCRKKYPTDERISECPHDCWAHNTTKVAQFTERTSLFQLCGSLNRFTECDKVEQLEKHDFQCAALHACSWPWWHWC